MKLFAVTGSAIAFATGASAVAPAGDFACFPIKDLLRIYWLSDNGFDEVSKEDFSKTEEEFKQMYPKAMATRRTDKKVATELREYLRSAHSQYGVGKPFRFTAERFLHEGDCFSSLSWIDSVSTDRTWDSYFAGPPLPAKSAVTPSMLLYDLYMPSRLVDSKLLDPRTNLPGSKYFFVSTHRSADEFFGNDNVPEKFDVTRPPGVGVSECYRKPTADALQKILFNVDAKLYIVVHNKEHLDGFLKARGPDYKNDLIHIVGPSDKMDQSTAETLADAIFENLRKEILCEPQDVPMVSSTAPSALPSSVPSTVPSTAPTPAPTVPSTAPTVPSTVPTVAPTDPAPTENIPTEPTNAPEEPTVEGTDLPPVLDFTAPARGTPTSTIALGAAGGVAGLAALAGGAYYLAPSAPSAPTMEGLDEGDYGDDEMYRDSAVTVNEDEFLEA